MGREKLEFTNPVILSLGCMTLFVIAACANADNPSLSAVPTQSEATTTPPEIVQQIPEEQDISVQEPNNEAEVEQEEILVEDIYKLEKLSSNYLIEKRLEEQQNSGLIIINEDNLELTLRGKFIGIAYKYLGILYQK